MTNNTTYDALDDAVENIPEFFKRIWLNPEGSSSTVI